MTRTFASTRAVHFGIYPTAGFVKASVDDHDDPSVEHEILVPAGVIDAGVEAAFVSGSWACWGPADQSGYDDEGNLVEQSEGDNSLHLVFFTDRIDALFLASLHFAATFLSGADDGEARVLDYAVVTDRADWSQQTHVVTFIGNPMVVVSATTQVDAGDRVRSLGIGARGDRVRSLGVTDAPGMYDEPDEGISLPVGTS